MARPRTYPLHVLQPGESLTVPWLEPEPWGRRNRHSRRLALAAIRQEQRLYYKRFQHRSTLAGLEVTRTS